MDEDNAPFVELSRRRPGEHKSRRLLRNMPASNVPADDYLRIHDDADAEQSFLDQIRDALVQAIETTGISQKELARRIDRSASRVSHMLSEGAGANYEARTIARLSRALGMEPSFELKPALGARSMPQDSEVQRQNLLLKSSFKSSTPQTSDSFDQEIGSVPAFRQRFLDGLQEQPWLGADVEITSIDAHPGMDGIGAQEQISIRLKRGATIMSRAVMDLTLETPRPSVQIRCIGQLIPSINGTVSRPQLANLEWPFVYRLTPLLPRLDEQVDDLLDSIILMGEEKPHGRN